MPMGSRSSRHNIDTDKNLEIHLSKAKFSISSSCKSKTFFGQKRRCCKRSRYGLEDKVLTSEKPDLHLKNPSKIHSS